MHDPEFNRFLDGLMGCLEVFRITIADHLMKEGWDSCDIDMDIEIKGGRGGQKLADFLKNYEAVNFFTSINKQTGKKEMSGHHGAKFWCIGKYFIEIAWGHKPHTVPYLVVRERGIKKKKWLQAIK